MRAAPAAFLSCTPVLSLHFLSCVLWKEYMEKLMNEENDWDHGILPGAKKGPADCIKTSNMTAALKKMKKT